MKNSPAFQFYPADFLADENVVLMSNQEIGCYIKLMCFCWREGSIPNEIEKIAKLCGENSSAMAELWHSLKLCFKVRNGRLIHPRLEKEKEKQRKFKAERSNSGKLGAAKRWGKDSSAIARPVSELMANDSSLSLSSSLSINNIIYVKLTAQELQKLCNDYGEKIIASKIEDLETYIKSNKKGKDPYKDHNLTLRNWLKREGIEKKKIEFITCPHCQQQSKPHEIKSGKCPVCQENIK